MQGQLLGNRYRIKELIGEGGMASVYVATDEKLDRQVAVKVLHPHLSQNADIRERFQMEARAISGVEHPNIIKIYDYSGSQSDRLWIVVEILRGKNLAQYAKQFPGCQLHPIHAALIVREVTKALEKAHQAGIVHRDIKPENIMILETGRIKLMDFGIAKNLHRSNATMTGTFMGSPSYMSPEQIRGKDIDRRSDIYSLGVLFYEIIGGVLPFTGGSTADVINKIMVGKYSEVVQIAPGTPRELNDIIIKMMRYQQNDRYDEVANLGSVIDAFLRGFGFAESHVELERMIQDPDRFRRRLEASGIEDVKHASVVDRDRSTEAISRLTTRERRGKSEEPKAVEAQSEFQKAEGTRIARIEPVKKSATPQQMEKTIPLDRTMILAAQAVARDMEPKTTVERPATPKAMPRETSKRVTHAPSRTKVEAHKVSRQTVAPVVPQIPKFQQDIQNAHKNQPVFPPRPAHDFQAAHRRAKKAVAVQRPAPRRQTFHVHPTWRWYAVVLLALQCLFLLWGFQALMQKWRDPPGKKVASAVVKNVKPRVPMTRPLPPKIQAFEMEVVTSKEPLPNKAVVKPSEAQSKTPTTPSQAPTPAPATKATQVAPTTPPAQTVQPKTTSIAKEPTRKTPERPKTGNESKTEKAAVRHPTPATPTVPVATAAPAASESTREPTSPNAIKDSSPASASRAPTPEPMPAPSSVKPSTNLTKQPQTSAKPETVSPEGKEKVAPTEKTERPEKAEKAERPQAASTSGFVKIQVEPAAEIYVNGTFRGTSNDPSMGQGIKLAPGSYSIELRRTGYGTSKQSVTVESNGRHVVQARLAKEAAQRLKFTIRSNKTPFSLTVENLREGGSETTTSDQKRHVLVLAPGTYKVTVEAEGQTLQRTVTLSSELGATTFNADFKTGDGN